MAAGPHISLSAETVFTVAGFPITNSIINSLIVSTTLITFALIANKAIKSTNKPTGFQNFVEAIIEAFYGLVYSVTQNHHKAHTFFPVIATFFFFIVLNNWSGLIPGVGTIGVVHESGSEYAEVLDALPTMKAQAATAEGDSKTSEGSYSTIIPIFRPGSADLNTTLALGIVSVAITQFIGFRYLKFSYFKKFINFSSPIMFIVGILELISEFAKIISFAFRLFGNIFAGEVLLVVIAYISGSLLFFAPIPFYGLEVFVGFIQALVFSMLTLVFFNMATISHDEH